MHTFAVIVKVAKKPQRQIQFGSEMMRSQGQDEPECTLTFTIYYFPPTGSARSSQATVRNHSTAERTTRVDKMAQPGGVTFTRTHRRAPQSSSGPRQPDRALTRTPMLKQRRQHNTKPQADQRNQHKPKLSKKTYSLYP